MKVRLIKTERSDEKGWSPSHADRYINKIGEISEVHHEYDAIQLKIVDTILGEPMHWWFHCDDVIPAKKEKFQTKKETFDINNLVMGV
jgi:hypothetical protein